MNKDKNSKSPDGKFPPLLYGLDGVMSLFGVSRPKASRLVHGVIEGAVCRNGNLILIDTRKALELFGVEEPERFII